MTMWGAGAQGQSLDRATIKSRATNNRHRSWRSWWSGIGMWCGTWMGTRFSGYCTGMGTCRRGTGMRYGVEGTGYRVHIRTRMRCSRRQLREGLVIGIGMRLLWHLCKLLDVKVEQGRRSNQHIKFIHHFSLLLALIQRLVAIVTALGLTSRWGTRHPFSEYSRSPTYKVLPEFWSSILRAFPVGEHRFTYQVLPGYRNSILRSWPVGEHRRFSMDHQVFPGFWSSVIMCNHLACFWFRITGWGRVLSIIKPVCAGTLT